MRLTDEQLNELERMEKAATPGPWEHKESHHARNQQVESADVVDRFSEGIERPAFTMWAWKPGGRADARPNARFIAALRNAAPSLIEEVRELRKELAEVKRCKHRYVYSEQNGGMLECMSCGERIDAAMKESLK